MRTQLIPYTYRRDEIEPGILHIGVGNFHRAHQAFYTHRLLEEGSGCKWGISGVMLLPGDERLYRALQTQANEYTLTVCGRDGKDEAYRIGSLVELIWGVEDPGAVIRRIADSRIRILTLTITEGGYNLDKATGAFRIDEESVRHDLLHPAEPQTVFGFVAEGLRRRKAAGSGPLTILSCDNLQHNGHTARKAFTAFIEAQDAGLAAWVAANVTFPNSMVDRITPATRLADIGRLNALTGADDLAPVYCEDFIQWVIEDRFAAGRPAWERVGVEFTDDVTAYENMKLSLLNASHTLLSYPAFLGGYRGVDEAMRDVRIVGLVRTFMDTDITPYVPAPGHTDLEAYKQTLIERFANRSVSDQVARLCFDGISKFPVYIMPNLVKMIADGADLTRMAYLLAAYRHYLKYRMDDRGEAYEVAEPWMTEEDKKRIAADDPAAFLGLSAFSCTDLSAAPAFAALYRRMADALAAKGALAVLESILS